MLCYTTFEEFTEQVITRESEIEASERLNMVPASRKAINELKKFEYDGGDSIINKECTICFEDFQMGLEVTRLPCSHGFHGKCITTWLETSHLCPSGRFKMPVSDSV
ncbi:hypothetical protein AQUCO_00200528v1 [Aquilegia coerulea]|uniref:RING-type domain-containing protein n=1 Tax=Aquilegia coerulea TaxID=218851 RepID=A0A2G5F3Q5_AQUCA|nr:hypothetical protein AQUCO_00200528v1 [Aquilegia coerulea]